MDLLPAKDINLNRDSHIELYQRSGDNFFCLSEACHNLKLQPSKYLKSIQAKAVFALETPTDENGRGLHNIYPNLIYRDRSYSRIESGIWISPKFIDSFLNWVREVQAKNWVKYLPPEAVIDCIWSTPISSYTFTEVPRIRKLTDRVKVKKYWIREADGFVFTQTNSDFINGNVLAEFVEQLKQETFLRNLEEVARTLRLKLDRAILNDLSLPYLQKLYKLYKPLYSYEKIEGKEVLWLHPQLARIIYSCDFLDMAIGDWQRRTNCDNDRSCFITQISSWQFTNPDSADELKTLRYNGWNLQLYDAKDLLCLKISDANGYKPFVIDLKRLQIYTDKRLFERWVREDRTTKNDYTYQDYTCQAEIQRGENNPNTLYRLIPSANILAFEPQEYIFDDRSIYSILTYLQDGKSKSINIPTCCLKTIEHVFNTAVLLFKDKDARTVLRELGYTSPFIETAIVKHEEYRNLQFGDLVVRQKLSNGFVSANDFYRPFGKDLRDWLKNNSTFEFFKETAINEQLKYNLCKNTTSLSKRVLACFPELIERKSGSPESGGGTWVHPLISLKLAIDLSPAFAAKATRIVAEYYANKSSDRQDTKSTKTQLPAL